MNLIIKSLVMVIMALSLNLNKLRCLHLSDISVDDTLQSIYSAHKTAIITHIEPDLGSESGVIYSIYLNLAGNTSGSTLIARYDQLTKQNYPYVQSSAPSLTWSFTQINTSHIVIVDRNQHCIKMFTPGTNMSALAGECGVAKPCTGSSGYKFPSDVVYHPKTSTIYHTNCLRSRVLSFNLNTGYRRTVLAVTQVQHPILPNIFALSPSKDLLFISTQRFESNSVQVVNISESPPQVWEGVFDYNSPNGADIVPFAETQFIQGSLGRSAIQINLTFSSNSTPLTQHSCVGTSQSLIFQRGYIYNVQGRHQMLLVDRLNLYTAKTVNLTAYINGNCTPTPSTPTATTAAAPPTSTSISTATTPSTTPATTELAKAPLSKTQMTTTATTGWLPWHEWGFCTGTCGNGQVRYRYRSCIRVRSECHGYEKAFEQCRDLPPCVYEEKESGKQQDQEKPTNHRVVNITLGVVLALFALISFVLIVYIHWYRERKREKKANLRSIVDRLQNRHNNIKEIAGQKMLSLTPTTSVTASISSVTGGQLCGQIKFGPLTISLISGNLCDMKVDAIVNTTNESRTLSSGKVSAALLQQAGPELQIACNSLPSLSPGDVQITDGFQLQCSNVFHCNSAKKQPNDSVEETLYYVIEKCAYNYYQRGFKSIAMPALGTGQLGYSPDTVASAMVSAIIDIQRKHKYFTYLAHVYMVIFDQDVQTRKIFQDCFATYTGTPGFMVTNDSRLTQPSPSSGNPNYPATWTGTMQAYEEIILFKGSPVFAALKKEFLESLKTKAVVKQITRIQNPVAYDQYRIQRLSVEKKLRDVQKSHYKVERTLWHGTSKAAIHKISRSKFDRSLAGTTSGTAYGHGTYFSVTSEFANSYSTKGAQNPSASRYMIRASVITGQYCLGEKLMKTPPYIPGSAIHQYDSVVDKMNNPLIFVIFHDTAAYPEYVIEYTVTK